MNKFNLKKFIQSYSDLYPHHILPSSSFLEWFIGFVEGIGCFTNNNKSDLQFVITLSHKELEILQFIKNTLGFGNIFILSKSQNTYRFLVEDHQNIQLLCYLFNGNFVFPTRNWKFLIFLSYFNLKQVNSNLNIIPPIISTVLPSLKDYWLSGFTDAQGCFTISIFPQTNNFRARFSLSQNRKVNSVILLHILNLFNHITLTSIGEITSDHLEYQLRINGIENCKGIFKYFDEFKLKTKKLSSYEKFKQLLLRLELKHHLDPIKRIELIQLSKNINN